jgi:hypothetical protein
VFRTADILQNGVSAPVPLSSFFDTTPGTIFIGGAHPDDEKKEDKGVFQTLMDLFFGFVGWLTSWFPLPPVPDFSGVTEIAKATIPLVVTPPIVKAIKEIQTPGLSLPTGLPAGLPAGLSAGLPAGLPELPTMPTVTNVLPAMKGGGREVTAAGPGPAIAGVLAAVVLAGGLKGMYDFVNKHFA